MVLSPYILFFHILILSSREEFQRMNFDFAIIGSDIRLAYMAVDLIKRGYSVMTYGIASKDMDINCQTAASLQEALELSNIIIGPIPLTRDGKSISGEHHKKDLTIDSLKQSLSEDHLFFAGCIPEALSTYGEFHHLKIYDFMKDTVLTIDNTIATAEGAIAEAIIHQTVNIHDNQCLVLGYGRCAKTLANKLHGLTADVTIAARKKEALAEAGTYGFKILELSRLSEDIKKYTFIFNTIPSLIIDETILKKMNKDTLIIDIASSPGGIDFSKAKEYGINARLCLGLPGKYAPKSSAEALIKYIISVI